MAETVTVRDSRTTLATEPLRNFRFLVTINPPKGSKLKLAQMGFMACSGLNVETSVIAYRQGGYNTTQQKMPGQSEFPPLTLSKGVMVKNSAAYEWMRQIFSVIQGGGTFAPSAGHDFRTTVDIAVLQHPNTKSKVPVKLRFKVFNAWPASIGYSDLDAGGNAVLMEQMVLQHEGWRVTYAADNYTANAARITN